MRNVGRRFCVLINDVELAWGQFPACSAKGRVFTHLYGFNTFNLQEVYYLGFIAIERVIYPRLDGGNFLRLLVIFLGGTVGR